MLYSFVERLACAADLASQIDGISSDFAGLSNDADEHLSSEQLDWADIVFVMEGRQKKILTAKFNRHLRDTKVVVLNIPDKFGYMDKALVYLLRPKLDAALKT